MKNVVKKAELGFAECNFQNLDKKYLAYGVHAKQLFLPSKRQNEFYPPLSYT